MRTQNFRSTVMSGERLAGTFLKTPAYQLIEVLAQSGLDFVCLDAEHAPFDRSAMDACIAMGRALDFPVMVRTGDGSPREILQALDYGAAGVVVPHVGSVDKAREVARAARFGLHGRGYAGSSRWAGYATQKMPDLLQRSLDETIVIAQIEEPQGVEQADAIAAVEGIDGLFIGPADLSVGYGKTDQNSQELKDALRHVSSVAHSRAKAAMSFVPDAKKAQDWHSEYGLTMFFIASEHSWLRTGANQDAKGVHSISK